MGQISESAITASPNQILVDGEDQDACEVTGEKEQPFGNDGHLSYKLRPALESGICGALGVLNCSDGMIKGLLPSRV